MDFPLYTQKIDTQQDKDSAQKKLKQPLGYGLAMETATGMATKAAASIGSTVRKGMFLRYFHAL